MDLCWQSNVSAFQYAIQVGHNFPSSSSYSSETPLSLRAQLQIFRWLILFHKLLILCTFIFRFFFFSLWFSDWIISIELFSSLLFLLQSPVCKNPLKEFTISDIVLFYYRIFIWFLFIVCISLLILPIIWFLMFLFFLKSLNTFLIVILKCLYFNSNIYLAGYSPQCRRVRHDWSDLACKYVLLESVNVNFFHFHH